MNKLLKENIIGVGRTAEIYTWDKDKVLKLFFSWCPRGWVESEFRIIKSIQSYNIPIVKGFDIVEAENRLGIIYERIYGNSLLEELIANPLKAESIGTLLADLHSGIHELAAENLQSSQVRLLKNILKTNLISKKKRLILDVLAKLQVGDSLCHMDYHPGQILSSVQGPRIIDWGTACKGNPLADVAFTKILLRIARIHSSSENLQGDFQVLRKTLLEAYFKQYSQLQDIESGKEIEKWLLVMATSRLSEGIPDELNILNDIIEEQLDKIQNQ